MVLFAAKDPEGWMIEAGVWQEDLGFGIVRTCSSSSPKWVSSLSTCSSQSPGISEDGVVDAVLLIVSATVTRCSFGVRAHVTNLRRVASPDGLEPLDGVETERT